MDSNKNYKTSVSDIFVCYNSDDKNEVGEIIEFLRENKFFVAYDDDFLPGKQFTKLFSENLKQIRIAIICYGRKIGKWQEEEIPAFINEKKDRGILIIPILLENSDEKSIDPLISDVIRVDLNKDKKIELGRLKKSAEEFLNSNTAKSGDCLNTNEVFIPLARKEYEVYFNKLTQIDKLYNDEFFHFTRNELIEELKTKLEDRRFVFVIGPLHVGKTELIKSFKEKYFIDYRIIGTTREVEERLKASDKFSLYFYWYEIIIDEILDDAKIKRRIEPKKIKELKRNIEKFKDKLEFLRNEGELKSTLVAFIHLVDECKKDLNYRKDLVVTVHLDNMQYYADNNAFEQLKLDLEPLLNGEDLLNPDSKTLLIIATRYFPLALEEYITVNVTNLNKNEVDIILGSINEKIENIELFKNTVFKYTNGHPWFINRFLRCYFKMRQKDEFKFLLPEKLAIKIFDTINYWVDDKILFNENQESEFKNEFKKIVRKHSGDRKTFYEFLNTEEISIELSAEKYLSNLIIKETGYGIFEDDDTIISFNNKLIVSHFSESYIRKIISR